MGKGIQVEPFFFIEVLNKEFLTPRFIHQCINLHNFLFKKQNYDYNY